MGPHAESPVVKHSRRHQKELRVGLCRCLLRYVIGVAGLVHLKRVLIQMCVQAVGNIIGPQFFRSSQAPEYDLGIGAMLCCFAVMAATGVVYG